MNVLDELKRKDEEARALLSAEVDSVTVRIDELVSYRNSLHAEMKRRGYTFDSALVPATKSPSSSAVISAKSGIVHVSKDEPSLPERILGLLSDSIPRSLDEVFEELSGRAGFKRSTLANRLYELKNKGKIATMSNNREGAQPGSLLYVIPSLIGKSFEVKEIEAATPSNEPSSVVPKYNKSQKRESIVAMIHRHATDGIPRTGRELFDLVSPERPGLSFDSFRASFRHTELHSAPNDRPNAKPKELLFWLPKTESESPSVDIVQAPNAESDYPVDKLIWRLMSDGKPRTKGEIYEYVCRFNKNTTAAIIHRQIIRTGLISEMNGTVRVYRSRIAGNGT